MVQTSKAIEIEDLIKDPNFNINDWYGYIYMTCHFPTNRSYIGKKNFFHTSNKKLGKKEIAALPITRGRKISTKQVVKESDWKTYYGSAEEIKKIPKTELKRYLIRLCKTKKELTYWEISTLFKYNVLLEPERWINDNIQGRFFRKDFEELK